MSGAPAVRPSPSGLRAIVAALPAARRRDLVLLTGLMLIGGAAELATLGAVVPFLAYLARSPRVPGWLPSVSPTLAAALFAGAILVAAALRLLLDWRVQRTILLAGHELDLEVQRRILAQPYAWHLEHHSSGPLAALEKVQLLAFGVLLPLLRALVAGVLALAILAGLVILSGPLILLAGLVLAAAYGLIGLGLRRTMRRNSDAIGPAYDARIRLVQESLGGIRDIILEGSQDRHVEAFRAADRQLALARLRVTFFSGAPRHVIEAVGVLLLAGIAVVLARGAGGLALALPMLGALALGAQRLLPLLQQIYTAAASVAGNRQVAADVADLLTLPRGVPPTLASPLPLTRALELEGVRFRYPGGAADALSGIDLSIPRGQRIALTGRSGSGKSTLADLLMGLLTPSGGTIRLDGRSLDGDDLARWRAGIAHVPQQLFLFDSSLAANVALSEDAAIDRTRVLAALEAAQLGEWIATLPDGIDTRAGEQGVRLSGGQRQRIGLARAIYRDAQLLVLDEPTSALDAETEEAVLNVLARLQAEGRTIILISHRPTSLLGCDRQLRLEQGRIVA